MARITIIPSDGYVAVDGIVKIQPLDLSAANIPSNVHALQWYDNRGWIEFEDSADPFAPKPANQDISELPQWANACVAVWNAWTPPAPPEPVTPEVPPVA